MPLHGCAAKQTPAPGMLHLSPDEGIGSRLQNRCCRPAVQSFRKSRFPCALCHAPLLPPQLWKAAFRSGKAPARRNANRLSALLFAMRPVSQHSLLFRANQKSKGVSDGSPHQDAFAFTPPIIHLPQAFVKGFLKSFLKNLAESEIF